ncbi:oligosaccharide flippase family protein [Sphingomonas sp.]|uniref:oligosaccharide flippase family protein n=1 Tax=Sphingomonas sp. TaxID=28214 RepID=UPI003AFFC237
MDVKRSLAWLGAAQLLSFTLQFAASVVLARHLSLREAGIYAAALAVAGVLALIQTLGLQALIVREEELTDEVSATAFTVNALISLLLAAALLAISAAGGRWLGDPGVGRVLRAVAVVPLFAIFAFLPSAILERHGRFREIAVATTAGSVAGAVATMWLVTQGFGYMSAAYAQWATGLVAAIAINLLGFRHASLRVGFSAWRRVAEFGFQMLAVTGINQASTRLSELVLARFLGLPALGLFSRASSLNGLLWTNIHLLVGRVMLVDFAGLHRGGASLRPRYLQTVEIVTALLWPVFAGLAVLAPPFVQMIYGPRWVPAAAPLALLALSSLVQVAITMTWELFAATGELRAQTRIEFIRSLLALAAFVGGCLVSLEAAAAARVADALFALALYRPHLDRMTGTRTADFWPIYARSALLTLVACAPAAALMVWRGWSAATPLPLVLASVAAGGGLWVAALMATRHPLIAELRVRRRRA